MMDAEDSGEAPTKDKERKPARDRIFAVDRRAWAAACNRGMPAAVSYLVLACGTGGDQRTTRWSVDAITRHSGIGRPRAKKAVDELVTKGLVRLDKGGTRPQYHLVPGHEVVELGLAGEERHVLALIRAGHSDVPKVGRYNNVWEGGQPYKTALQLAEKGFVSQVAAQAFEPIEQDDTPHWIWLPSSLVESEEGAATPVERVRQSQNVGALRLFIDLYHAHDLQDGHGIDWRGPHGLKESFERIKIGEHRQFVVWGFRASTLRTWRSAPFCRPHIDEANEGYPTKPFWEALEILQKLRLVDAVPHLVDADSEHGEVLWPISPLHGEGCERVVGAAASRAAVRMLTEKQVQWANEQALACAAPVEAHMKSVQAIGIFRLHHLPRTEPTARWFAELPEQCEAVARRYEEMSQEAAAIAESATSR